MNAADVLEPGFLHRLPEPPRKVVLVRTSRIGDFIVATPAIRALRAALPGAEFTFVGLPFLRDLVLRSPHLDRFVEFSGYPGMAEQFFDARASTRFFTTMQAEGFDLAVQLNGSGVYSNPFTLMLGARYTVGWVRAGDGSGRLDAALPWPESGHEIDKVLSLPLFLGAAGQGRQTEFPLLLTDHQAASALVGRAPRPLIGLHPAAREATKRWAPERFAAVAAALHRGHGGTIVVLGGPDERELAGRVLQALALLSPQACETAIDASGRTDLGGLGALVEALAVLVTNDSGPAHVAYALGVPAVTIFGGTDPARWGPPALPQYRVIMNAVPCWPCDLWTCPTAYECLAGITEEQVTAAAEEVLRE